MPENDANPLGDANDIRTQKRIELDNLVLDKIRIYNGLTLRQIEDLKITIPEGLRTEKRPDKKIERKFLINSLSRLEGKTGETPKIYSRYKEEPIHGKSIKEYFYGTPESDKTIITIPDTTELSKDLMKNPCAYVHDNETIGICDATQKETVFDSGFGSIPAIIPLQKLGEDVVETNNKNKFKLPHSIITFFNLETREWYFAKPKFTNKGMLLRIIAPKESKENPSTKKPKNILVLEDYTKDILKN